ncbi:MAG: TetR/AcrR family transcriptional regulator [Muribaculaceae bacterium]|nr:TetR/AcrR family transcriptional regulator [Muribaculaceae bacterium]
MERPDISDQKASLFPGIFDVVLENGLKATTMDIVAERFGISKRTLYEIFESKNQMLIETLDYVNSLHCDMVRREFENCDTVIEAMLRISAAVAKNIQRINPSFFRDMDNLYSDMRENYEKAADSRRQAMIEIFAKGVDQGVFRRDVDFRIQARLLEIQLEAIKRMEGLFPEDIPSDIIYRELTVTFLRGIASGEGLEILSNILPRIYE